MPALFRAKVYEETCPITICPGQKVLSWQHDRLNPQRRLL